MILGHTCLLIFFLKLFFCSFKYCTNVSWDSTYQHIHCHLNVAPLSLENSKLYRLRSCCESRGWRRRGGWGGGGAHFQVSSLFQTHLNFFISYICKSYICRIKNFNVQNQINLIKNKITIQIPPPPPPPCCFCGKCKSNVQ